MGFRFRRSVKIAPGIRLNFSKSGVSTSMGGRGFTVNSRGRATVGIPGTGFSYSANLKSGRRAPASGSAGDAPKLSPEEARTVTRGLLGLVSLIAVVVIGANWPWMLSGALLLAALLPVGWLIKNEIDYRRPPR